jgi:hypothetical protein
MTTILGGDASWVWSRSNKPYDVFGYEKSRCDGNKVLYKVKSVKKVKEKYTHYDIQVEGMHDFCTVNGVVHNSEDQATIVYNYVCSYIDADAEVGKVVDKRTMSMTTKKGQSPTPELRCITASAKQVRGKHPGARRKAPGLLVVDEAAEVLDGLMKQALPMTKEARPPFNLIISTFHHAFGDFQEFWDNAEARGFVKLSLDSFDVCEKCMDDCSACIPEFDETYCQLVCRCYYNYSIKPEDRPSWHRYYYKEKFDYVRPEMMPVGCVSPEPCDACPVKDGCTAPKLRIKSVGDLGKECPTCKAVIEHKAKTGAGHFPVEEIRKAWRRNDKVTFEVEYMGWRPGRGIFVLDPYDVDMSLVRETAYSVYGSTRLGIDWGAAGVTAMVVVQYNVDSSIDVLDYYDMQAPSDTECYDMVGRLCRRYNISLIYADSSHVFQNTHIRNELGIMITPVNFQTQKELGVGVMRMKFERKLVRIPERFKPTLVRDLKNWRRDANGNILKKNDHGPDSLLCAMIEGAAFCEVVSAPPEVEEDLRETSYYNIWDRASF